MGKTERERRHQSNLERIGHVQVVTGRGDRIRVDHEGTVLERARMTAEELRSFEATERGLAAFDRLLRLVDERQSRDARDVAEFLGAVWNGQPLSLRTLRCAEPAVGDDMLAVLDAHRYARGNLPELVEGGPARVARVLRKHSAGRA